MDKKTLRNDLILILSLLLVATVSLIVVLTTNKVKDKQVAKIYVQNEVVETIDLSKKLDEDFYVNGIKGILRVHTHDGKIAVVESNCPHQDCVKMGYINNSGHPIICAYNAVTIAIEDGSPNDMEI